MPEPQAKPNVTEIQYSGQEVDAALTRVGRFVSENQGELSLSLQTCGYDDLAQELRGLIADWRRSTEAFLRSLH